MCKNISETHKKGAFLLKSVPKSLKVALFPVKVGRIYIGWHSLPIEIIQLPIMVDLFPYKWSSFPFILNAFTKSVPYVKIREL